MSLTKRTWGDSSDVLFTFTGSVTGATTKLSIVFQASNWVYGLTGSIDVYVDGTKQSCSWTTNSTYSMMGTVYKTKMTSSQMTISKPFFTLKLTHTQDSSVLYQQTFSFYEIEKAPTAATTSGGVMDGSTKSKVVFTTSVTDATYKATFTLGTHSGSATSTTKTLEYAIPLSWCTELPNKTTGTANIACQVLFGGQIYRTFNTTIAVSVPSSIVPTVTAFTLADRTDTPVPSSWNLFVQHQSGARLSSITCAGAQGSTISTVRLQVGTQSTSNTYSASDLPQINTITQSGSLTVTVTVTDSRGRTGTKTGTVTFTPYSAPKFTRCISERCDSSGELDNDGTYFRSTTTVEYSSCGGNNAVTMTMKYKKTDAVVYNPEVTLVPGVNICGEGNLDTEFSYDVMYIVSDQFRSVSFMDYVSTAIYLMHFLHGGKGVAFGQKATIEDCVDFNFHALFRKLATFLGTAKFRQSDKDRVVINDPQKSSPLMVDPTGAGTLYPIVLSNSPAFTGTPTAPTASAGTNTTQLATTAFVGNAVNAVYSSPTFTGTPKATTAAVGTNTTQLATTAFVHGTVHKQATQIYNTKVTAADVSTTYKYTTISALANWNMVVMHVAVHNTQQNLVFMRPFQGGQLLSDTPTSTAYIRGGYVVDWANNRVGVRCVNGTTAQVATVYFDYIYGIF